MFGIIGNWFVIVITFLIISYTFVRSKKTNLIKWFLFFNLSVALWCLGPILINLNFIPFEYKIWIQRFCYFFGIFVVYGFMKTVEFLECFNHFLFIKKIGNIICCILVIFVFTPYFIPHLTKLPNGLFQSNYAVFYFVFIGYLIFGFGIALYNLYLGFSNNTKIDLLKKNQIKYIFTAYVIEYLGGAVYFVTILRLISVSTFAGYFVAIGQVIVFYVIINDRLINIKTSYQYFVNFILYLLIALVIFSPLIIFSKQPIYSLIILSISFLAIPFLAQQVLNNKKLNHNIQETQESNIHNILKWIKTSMNIKEVSLFVKQDESHFISYTDKETIKNKNIIEFLKKTELPYLFTREHEELGINNDFMNYEIICPLFGKSQNLVGILFLGEKEGSFYDSIDLKKIETITSTIVKFVNFEIELRNKQTTTNQLYHNQIAETLKRIIEIKNIKQLAQIVLNIVLRITHSNIIGFYLLDNNDNFVLKHSKNLNLKIMANSDSLIEVLKQRKKILTIKN